jgi:hypothetical protein
MAMVQREVIEIEWNEAQKGKEILGRLVSVEVVQYKDGPGLVYTMKGKNLGEVLRFKGATRLNQRLHKSDVGKVVIVRYNGADESKQMGVGMSFPKDFTVGVDEDSANPATITDEDVPF